MPGIRQSPPVRREGDPRSLGVIQAAVMEGGVVARQTEPVIGPVGCGDDEDISGVGDHGGGVPDREIALQPKAAVTDDTVHGDETVLRRFRCRVRVTAEALALDGDRRDDRHRRRDGSHGQGAIPRPGTAGAPPQGRIRQGRGRVVRDTAQQVAQLVTHGRLRSATPCPGRGPAACSVPGDASTSRCRGRCGGRGRSRPR